MGSLVLFFPSFLIYGDYFEDKSLLGFLMILYIHFEWKLRLGTSDNLLLSIQEKIKWADTMSELDKKHRKEVEERVEEVKKSFSVKVSWIYPSGQILVNHFRMHNPWDGFLCHGMNYLLCFLKHLEDPIFLKLKLLQSRIELLHKLKHWSWKKIITKKWWNINVSNSMENNANSSDVGYKFDNTNIHQRSRCPFTHVPHSHHSPCNFLKVFLVKIPSTLKLPPSNGLCIPLIPRLAGNVNHLIMTTSFKKFH